MGFEPLAYKGLETGSREVVSHVIKQGKVSMHPGVLAWRAPVCPAMGYPVVSGHTPSWFQDAWQSMTHALGSGISLASWLSQTSLALDP